MTIGNCDSLDKAIQAIQSIRSYKPYKYSGTWYVSHANGEGLAYRSKSDLVNKLRKSGIDGEWPVAIVK